MNTCIRNVNEKDWVFFKTEAVRVGKTAGAFFGVLVNKYAKDKKESSSKWKDFFESKPFLTDNEAEKVKKAAERVRAEFDLR